MEKTTITAGLVPETEPASENLEAIAGRLLQELRSAADRQIRDAEVAADDIIGAVQRDGLARAQATFEACRAAIAEDRSRQQLDAIMIGGNLPPSLQAALDEASHRLGRPTMVVLVPTESTSNGQPQKAWLLADISIDVWR